jgi:hypothetical protein
MLFGEIQHAEHRLATGAEHANKIRTQDRESQLLVLKGAGAITLVSMGVAMLTFVGVLIKNAGDSLRAPAPSANTVIPRISISMTVASTKDDGWEWDAFGGAPDIALCVTMNGRRTCEPGGGTSVSAGVPAQCQDSLTCAFEFQTEGAVNSLTVEAFDIDASANDIIGSGTCMIGQTDCRVGQASLNVQRRY